MNECIDVLLNEAINNESGKYIDISDFLSGIICTGKIRSPMQEINMKLFERNILLEIERDTSFCVRIRYINSNLKNRYSCNGLCSEFKKCVQLPDELYEMIFDYIYPQRLMKSIIT